jgi:hypothetical protein
MYEKIPREKYMYEIMVALILFRSKINKMLRFLHSARFSLSVLITQI